MRSRGYLSSDPAHWLSQDPPRKGTIDTPLDTISTAFDPPGGDFHFKPFAHYARSPDEQLSLLGNQCNIGS